MVQEIKPPPSSIPRMAIHSILGGIPHPNLKMSSEALPRRDVGRKQENAEERGGKMTGKENNGGPRGTEIPRKGGKTSKKKTRTGNVELDNC